jgi:hypothetical protein
MGVAVITVKEMKLLPSVRGVEDKLGLSRVLFGFRRHHRLLGPGQLVTDELVRTRYPYLPVKAPPHYIQLVSAAISVSAPLPSPISRPNCSGCGMGMFSK